MVIVAFPPGEKYAVNYTTLDQYDYGQILRIQGLKLPKTVEVHFSTQETGGISITRVGVTKDGVTDVLIPDSVLENGDTTQNYSIYAFVYVTDATSGKTEYRAKLEVKARPKPEVPGGGDNPDIFHEAVLEVRKSAEKAEEAQKQAEGWAHGREDLPERAEDNAMYYAGKASEDAKKTAQDRAEVERLVESVSGIDEQVTKVEELSKNAQEAATQAGTSAGQAELHKQAAETAKESVENLSAQVQKNKESVDKTTQDFTLKAQQALADVNNAGQAQTERVQSAGTTAVENIKTAQNTATQAVETAKAEAIKTVADKGKEVLEAIPNFDAKLDTKLDKNQGAEHAGKALVIGEDGNVVPGEVQTEGVGDAADAIVNTASGNLLLIKDSSGRKNKGFGITGKIEQVQTTGKNILPYSVELGAYSANTPDKIDIDADNTRCRITEPIQINDGFNGIISIFGSYQIFVRLFKNNKFVTESGFLTNYKLDNTLNKFDLLTVVIRKPDDIAFSRDEFKRVKIQLEKGTTATAYEPYTGGKPSPSPEYPQEIVNAGKWNEAKQKYEIDIRVNTGNLFNETTSQKGYYTGDVGGKSSLNSTLGCSYETDINIGAGVEITVSIQTTVNTRSRIYAVDLNGIILYKYEDFSANASDNNHTLIVPDRTKKILVSILEISSPEDAIIMVNVGKTQLPYEPYKEQILPLTSDRPLTKWDRLTEQDGQIGWLYKSEIINKFDGKSNRISMGAKKGEVQHFLIEFKNTPKGNGNADIYVDKYRAVQTSFTMTEFGICCNWNDGIKYFSAPNINITNTEEFKAWLSENPLTLEYETETTEFLPLPQQEQDAIRALTTYYPTTVVSNSEDAEMQLTYVADTKNYTDNKIKEAVSAQTQSLANLLSLMPLSTQAAMIEADTNNILDNMEVQK